MTSSSAVRNDAGSKLFIAMASLIRFVLKGAQDSEELSMAMAAFRVGKVTKGTMLGWVNGKAGGVLVRGL